MARKTVSVCDRCRARFADYSLHVREATMNVELKLTSTKDKKPGPFDLCAKCLDEIVNNIMSGYKGEDQPLYSSTTVDPVIFESTIEITDPDHKFTLNKDATAFSTGGKEKTT